MKNIHSLIYSLAYFLNDSEHLTFLNLNDSLIYTCQYDSNNFVERETFQYDTTFHAKNYANDYYGNQH